MQERKKKTSINCKHNDLPESMYCRYLRDFPSKREFLNNQDSLHTPPSSPSPHPPRHPLPSPFPFSLYFLYFPAIVVLFVIIFLLTVCLCFLVTIFSLLIMMLISFPIRVTFSSMRSSCFGYFCNDLLSIPLESYFSSCNYLISCTFSSQEIPFLQPSFFNIPFLLVFFLCNCRFPCIFLPPTFLPRVLPYLHPPLISLPVSSSLPLPLFLSSSSLSSYLFNIYLTHEELHCMYTQINCI